MDKVIYEPNKYLKMGIKIWPQMFSEIIEFRELTWRLFIRNLGAKYKQAALGYFWVIITPFIAIGTFAFLNKAGIVNIGKTDLPYPLFALIGLTIWQLFSSGLNFGCNSLVSAGEMISKINFPRETLVIASIAQAIFDFIVKLVLIVVLFFVYRYIPSWKIIFFPVLILPILVLTIGLSLFLSLLTGVIRDTANAVTLLTTFFMFLTPVLYPIASDKHIFFKLNPLSSLINAPRDLIVYGYIADPMSFIISSVLSILIFLISWRVFHLVETKIPERM
ncbi:MAG: ABC transporter permease [Candidatus Omnitrophica bacterium]|nr:ABC transporter permease [Candidatus Omnitrophota bacterium]MBU1997156.1 ABC transporter permease [Candidatus Omnitrophota bacterium]MBU4333818.1 ABC transporter permease [Candidatus Omnitrophota bacterium]